ncbi:DUF2017 family protein [Longispora albida]|uniref:DUF2017 family protein n=1 Tax=Longispora albida TaxID=203523 RepID=UPI0003AA91B4|nr:DUF2017 family protein [Longispora albida]
MSFVREGDAISVKFDPEDVEVLRSVLTQVSGLIAEGDSADPALARLFPDIYADDPEAAAEIRKYTQSDLKQEKLDAAGVLIGQLGEHVTLTTDQADAWLRALNDARLVLAIRLGIGEDFDIEGEDDPIDEDPDVWTWIYRYLSYLQASLIDVL